MPIHLLDNAYPWLASHSGFSLLPRSLQFNGCRNIVIQPRNNFVARAIGKSYSTWKRHSPRNQFVAAAECNFLLSLRLRGGPGHVLFLEEHLRYLPPASERMRWIGMIHLPRRCWDPSDLDLLRALPGVLVLCDSMRDQFDDIIDRSMIKVLPYGVDTSFFKPANKEHNAAPQRLLYVGAWLRNTAMMARLIPEISRRFPTVVFDFVVPLHARGDESISALRDNPAVRWHHNLKDEELRELYQQATAMLMPMNDSGASSAIIEALACGLPIVTTDVGGIRSYGGETVFPLIKNNDDKACLDLVATYLTEPEIASAVSKKCREFAEAKLEWTIAAKEYIDAYRSFGFFRGCRL
jgi:glycosyltransferase involved in cell wall biosynthesis